ncbi:MAG: tetratricopeptide repeat protein [Pseudomonadota bacterium]
MTKRHISAAFIAALITAPAMGLVVVHAAGPAWAQGTPPAFPDLEDEAPALPQPPADLPPTPELAEEGLKGLDIPSDQLGREAQLDALFSQLSDAANPHWPVIQAQIWRVWRRSGSDSMDLLLARGMEAMEEKDYDAAEMHLSDLVRLAPDFAEGWNQRATLYFMMEDYGRSVADIEAVLALEPRHFGALSGLGIILDRTGYDQGALEAYRRVLELHPNMPGAQKGVEKLSPEVDGREL